MASRAGKKEAAAVAKVSAKVYLGHPEDPSMDGFGLRVEIIVENFDDSAIIQAAHEASTSCPLSRLGLL
jgi:organic hydroperoxide reductase OsmC/OhrA